LVSCILISCGSESEDELVGDWERRAVFPENQRSFAATFVIGDCGYVVGGWNGTSTLLKDVYMFDHQGGAKSQDDRRKGEPEGSWEERASLPDEALARYQAVGFSLETGGKWYGYVGTGWGYDPNGTFSGKQLETFKDFWRYNPETNSWEEIASLPDGAKPRRGALAFSLKVGSLWYGYVGFGYDDEPGRSHLADLWCYDPVNDLWEKVEGYSGAKRAGATAFVIDNKAYICNGTDNIGGSSNISDFYVFDPNAAESERWRRLRQMVNANPDEDYDDEYGGLPRTFGVSFVVKGNLSEPRGHITGGGSSSTWEYDHHDAKDGGDLWMRRTNFYNNASASSRQGMISFSFATGKAYVGLGNNGNMQYDEMWEFYPLDEDVIYADYK